jgi:hypothetical protein
MSIELKGFLTRDSFSEEIEKLVLGGLSYFDAVIEFAAECDKDPEAMLPYFSQVILDKVRKSATDLGYHDTGEINLDI